MAKIKSLNPKKEAAFKYSGPETQKVTSAQMRSRPAGSTGGHITQKNMNTPFRNAPDTTGQKVTNVSRKYPDSKIGNGVGLSKTQTNQTKAIKTAQNKDVKNARAARAAKTASNISKVGRATNIVGAATLGVEALNAAKSAYTAHKTESNFNKMASNPPAKKANVVTDKAAKDTMARLPIRVNPSNNSAGDSRRPEASKKLKK